MRYYTDSHEWVMLIDAHVGRVGISEYGRKELGEIVYIELPKVGQKVKAGEEICVLESTKAAADVYTPLSGEITAVHDLLRQNLHSLNQDPESAGWMFEIKLSHPEELKRLLSREEYLSLLNIKI